MKTRVWIVLVLSLALPVVGTEPTSTQTVQIQVIFTEKTEVGEYRDALYYTIDDPGVTVDKWLQTKQADIDAVKRSRVDNWVNLVKNPPKPIEPTKEQLESELVAVEKGKVELEARKATLTAQIAALTAIKPIAEVKEEVKP